MKNAIPRYNFYKTKYGSELLIDVVDLQYTRKFLTQGKVHILTYYDITFITEGEGEFTIGNRTHLAAPGDVFFSKPGEVRSWDTDRIGNGHALLFEDTFLTSFFKDPLFVQHLPFFRMGKMVDKLQLPNGLYARILQLLHDIKVEIDSFHPHDTGILRALLYEVLMLLNRVYRTSIPPETGKEPHKDISSFHLSRFFELVGEHFREQHSVQFYADKLCITPNYLNEILSSAININAKQYILNKVTDEAQRLLTYTDLPISEIASELHFSTVSYFVRSFRQCIGYTPLAYRKMEKP